MPSAEFSRRSKHDSNSKPDAPSVAEVVVITGASAGVGRATAQAFARRGARVALLARGKGGLAGAVKDVERAGGRALAIQTDVSESAQVERAAHQIEKHFGPIDVWVNNAMCSVFSPVKKQRRRNTGESWK